jgi:hypothetical protein
MAEDQIDPALQFCVRCGKHPCECTEAAKKIGTSDIARKEYVQRQ